MPSALVTGATAGIGAAFARQLAAAGHDLVLVARDAHRLSDQADALAAQHAVAVAALPADLSTDEGRELVAARIGDDPPDLVVNNAGMSLNTPFLRSTPEKEAALLHLNVHAVMHLTLAALPGMVRRRHGAVINVSSVSAFGVTMPGSTYPATKAWVNSFSESVALSVARYGVRVMALCPGYVRTEFHQRAGIDMAKMPDWAWLDADRVVRTALADLGRGKLVSVPSVRYKLASAGLRWLPRRLVMRVTRDTRGRISPADTTG